MNRDEFDAAVRLLMQVGVRISSKPPPDTKGTKTASVIYSNGDLELGDQVLNALSIVRAGLRENYPFNPWNFADMNRHDGMLELIEKRLPKDGNLFRLLRWEKN